MSFLFGGQLSTDKLISQFVYIFIVPFPVWVEINLIPAQTGNGIIDMWKYNGRILSVDHWPPKKKDMLQ